MQNTAFSRNKTLNVSGKLLDLKEPKVMGILNITPDSFYDGGRLKTIDDVIRLAAKMLSEGATFLDIGGYSSRPGAIDISEEEELSRVLPAVEAVLKNFPDAMISVDTFRSRVAREACAHGAVMINDISGGLLDHAMIETVAQLGLPYVLMHMRGTPQTMNRLASYRSVASEVMDELSVQIARFRARGVANLIVDPGFGFAKNVSHNFELLRNLDKFSMLDAPLLVGLSRKSMVWKTLGITPEEALNGTTAMNAIALMQGTDILRVHDVKEAIEVIKLVREVKGRGDGVSNAP